MASGLEGVIAIDIWLAVCMVFTGIALTVFALVHSILFPILGIITMASGLEGVIAIDIWLAVCMVFTGIALTVFALVHNRQILRPC